jgi:hypothetical protein
MSAPPWRLRLGLAPSRAHDFADQEREEITEVRLAWT